MMIGHQDRSSCIAQQVTSSIRNFYFGGFVNIQMLLYWLSKSRWIAKTLGWNSIRHWLWHVQVGSMSSWGGSTSLRFVGRLQDQTFPSYTYTARLPNVSFSFAQNYIPFGHIFTTHISDSRYIEEYIWETGTSLTTALDYHFFNLQ